VLDAARQTDNHELFISGAAGSLSAPTLDHCGFMLAELRQLPGAGTERIRRGGGSTAQGDRKRRAALGCHGAGHRFLSGLPGLRQRLTRSGGALLTN